MFQANAKFQELRATLKQHGVTMTALWSAKRGPMSGKYDDVAFFAFQGNDFSPAVTTAIVIDYGDGYGLYVETGSLANHENTIAGDVQLIVGYAGKP